MQVLAQQTSLDQNLTGGDIQNAFQKSGIFLEASLASGSVPRASGVPDLKAALIVLRQTLVAALGPAAWRQSPRQRLSAGRHRRFAADPPRRIRDDAASAAGGADAGAVPGCERRASEILLPQARLPLAADLARPGSAGRGSCFRKRCSMPGRVR